MARSAPDRPSKDLSPSLNVLAHELGQLDSAKQDLVIAAARKVRRLQPVPWTTFWKAHGAADVGGGDALEDSRALYDE